MHDRMNSSVRIALIGPGYGHNIKPYLEYFNTDRRTKVDFFFHTKESFECLFGEVRFLKIFPNILRLIFFVKRYDVIWLMGGGRLVYAMAFINLLKRKEAQTILNIWSESLPRKANLGGFRGFLLRKSMKSFTIINCNWYGTADLLVDIFGPKVRTRPLGLTYDNYSVVEKLRLELKNILGSVDSESYNFFYPKSFTYSSRHDLVIEAVNILSRKDEVARFKVYFLEGNVVDETRKSELIEMIAKYNLQDVVILLPNVAYFSAPELNVIWKVMDCGLQMAEHDQLSHTIWEPIVNGKDIVISDIAPYRYIETYFGFCLPLTPLNVYDVVNVMTGMINGENRASDKVKMSRIDHLKACYDFEANFRLILDEICEKVH